MVQAQGRREACSGTRTQRVLRAQPATGSHSQQPHSGLGRKTRTSFLRCLESQRLYGSSSRERRLKYGVNSPALSIVRFTSCATFNFFGEFGTFVNSACYQNLAAVILDDVPSAAEPKGFSPSPYNPGRICRIGISCKQVPEFRTNTYGEGRTPDAFGPIDLEKRSRRT